MEKHINQKYKDRIFRLVFSDRKDLLELYNAVNGSSYTDPDALEITTLEDAIYISMKNDISFLIDDILNLYEHQSTYNPNMPVRGFLYLAEIYRQYIDSRKLNLYSSRLMRLPVPQYLVFYNGLRKEPDRMELKLSRAFGQQPGIEPCMEFRAVMLNINMGNNRELLERCRRLGEYSGFVAKVREKLADGGEIAAAVDAAVVDCIRDGILADILSAHRAEVSDMILTEYNEEEHIAMEREEAKLEGIEQGKELLLIDMICRKLRNGRTVETIAKELDEESEKVSRICSAAEPAAPDYDSSRVYAILHEEL